jgi:hypothetical protein
VLGGCGGGGEQRSSQPPRGPKIPRDVAQRLAAGSDAVAAALAAGDCGRAQSLARGLQQETIRSIARVPPRLLEDLQSGVNVLVDDISCRSAAPTTATLTAEQSTAAESTTGQTTTAQTTTAEQPQPPPPPGKGHGKGHGNGGGKGHGKGHEKKPKPPHDQGDQGD